MSAHGKRSDGAAIPIDRRHGGVALPGVIDFSASVNPLGPPPQALEAYHLGVSRISSYPPSYADTLEARIAEWAGVARERVIAANGSTQLIHLLARVLGSRCPSVVIPTFSEIANALVRAGSTPQAISLRRERSFVLDVADIDAALETGADAVFVGRPNSPTGGIIDLGTALDIAARCARHGAWCVFDEAFVDFVDDAESLAGSTVDNPHLIVLRSLTKIFAIPGLRLGFAVAAPEIIARLRDAIEPWSVNVAAENVALACLENPAGYLRRTRETIARERAFLVERLSSTPGFRVFPPTANFLMIEIESEESPGAFGAQMLTQGIAVRDLAELPGCHPGLYRIGVRLRAENEKLLSAIRTGRS